MKKFFKGSLGLFFVLICLQIHGASEFDSQNYEIIYLGTKTTQELNIDPEEDVYPENTDDQISANNEFNHIKINPITRSLKALRGNVNTSKQSIAKVGVNFAASTFADNNGAHQIPTNPQGSAGEKQYIVVSYNTVRSFSKKTGKPDGILNSNGGTFFSVFGITLPGGPLIKYDPFSKRWFAVGAPAAFGTTIPGNITLVVSSDSIITKETKWLSYLILNSKIVAPGQPAELGNAIGFGIDQNRLYINPLSTFNGITRFSGIVVNKKALLENDLTLSVFNSIRPDPSAPDNVNTVLAATDNFDKDPQFGYYLYMTTLISREFETNNELQLYRVVNPESLTPTLVGPITITVPTYAIPRNAPHKGNVKGVSGFVFSNSTQILNPVVRNRQLYACHGTGLNSSGMDDPNGDRTGIRWYQFDLTGDPTGQGLGVETPMTVPVIVQSGTWYDQAATSPRFYWLPAINVNKKNDVVITASSSAENKFIDVFYTGRRKNDPKGTLRKSQNITYNHQFTYNNYNYPPNSVFGLGGSVWGKFAQLSVDPVNQKNFWSTSMWAGVPNGWTVQATELKTTNE